MKKIPFYRIIVLISFFALTMMGCKSKKAAEETVTTEPLTEESSGTLSNKWIEESEMDKLSNTWVDVTDTAEVSSTWTEDAYADKLSASGTLANSWVDETGETIYKQGDVPPEFKGGRQELFNYLMNNIKNPADVEKGTVYVAFVVGSDGTIIDVRVYKGVKESMDKEAVRLISGMPKWDPGMVNGKAASVVYGLPIIFIP